MATDNEGSRESPLPSGLQRHSCVLCQQRKVKCSRTVPCSNCQKAERPCEYKTPLPPKRRPRKAPELGLHARVKRYEQLLTKFGVKVEDVTADGEEDDDGDPMEDVSTEAPYMMTMLRGAGVDSEGRAQAEDADSRLVVAKSGTTRYFERTFWKDINDEIHPSQPEGDQWSDEERAGLDGKSENYSKTRATETAHIILGGIDKDLDVDSLFPPHEIAMRLWKVFLENVDPLCKLFHAPTTEKLLFHNEKPRKDGRLPKNARALAFTIFFFAIISLTDDECEKMTGESRHELLARYREATQISLVRAGVLKTQDIVVLQAYSLFVMAIRQYYDSRSLWILSGVAVRIAQRMGINREGGASDLTPFQIEMRRRLWWQILILDRTAAEISGAGVFSNTYQWTAKVPLNVDDSELSPNMTDFPKEKEGATEMIFCSMRYELGDFFRSINFLQVGEVSDSPWKKSGSKGLSMQDKDKAIEELQRRFEQKYLRYCDPLNRLHFFVSVVSRSMLAMFYMVIHHPRNYSKESKENLPQEEMDALFEKALKIIEYGNLIQGSPATKGFLWHTNVFFTWQAFIFMLDHLIHVPFDQYSEKSWEQLQLVYEHHPALISERSNTLHAAVRRLTLRAWEAREKHCSAESLPIPAAPQCIKTLRHYYDSRANWHIQTADGQQKNSRVAFGALPFDDQLQSQQQQREQQPQQLTPSDEVSAREPSFSDFETPTDWSQWEDLIMNFDWQNMDSSGMFNFDFMNQQSF